MANEDQAPVVGIVMSSISDAETMRMAREVLDTFGIPSEIRILSSHRTPKETATWVSEARGRGMQIIIAASGLAAHLAGVAASYTTLPVLGVPIGGGALSGLDALLSTVQMPRGTPVATFAVGSAGAVNAALFAVRILAVNDARLLSELDKYQNELAEQVLASDAEVSRR